MAIVTGSGPEELRRLAAELKAADPLLRKNLAKAFREAAKPVVKAAQDAILESPSDHDGTLRREVAKTVSAAVSTGNGKQVTLNIVSRGSRMPEGKDKLPGNLNGDRWRHPVFGNRRNWVPQRSRAEGWFSETIAGRARGLQAAAEAAMEETARELEG